MDFLKKLFGGGHKIDSQPKIILTDQPQAPSSNDFFQNIENPFADMPHVELTTFPNLNSNNIVIIVPGYDRDGRSSKYESLIRTLLNNNIGAVLLTNNVPTNYTWYSELLVEQLSKIIDHAIVNARIISGIKSGANIFMIGSSAGGGGVAAVSGQFPEVRRILLLGPSLDVDESLIRAGLERFNGELTVVRGDQDNICSNDVANRFFEYSKRRSSGGLETVINGSHSLRLPGNQEVLEQIALRVFAQTLEP